MDKIKLPTAFLILTLVFVVAACGSATSGNVQPTARPYTPEAVDNPEAAALVEGNAQDGEAVFAQYCSGCHSIQEGEDIEGPSLYQAGDRMDYDYVKESVLYPEAHLAFVEGRFEVDDTTMPVDFQEWMSEQQLEDVIAYVLSLK